MNEDEFINIDNLISKKSIYQIQIKNNNILIKKIGEVTNIPEIIIKENFGENNSLNLYSCVYTTDEFSNNNQLYYPLIKLTCNNTNDNYISSIAIKFNTSLIDNENLKIDEMIEDYEIFFIKKNNNLEYFNYEKLEKCITSENIIEKIIELSIK